MSRVSILLLFILLNLSYGQKEHNLLSLEKDYVLDDRFEVGDARRYGIYPDSIGANNSLNPRIGKYRMHALLDLAEKTGLTINFPKGYYGVNILIDSRENINLNFNHSGFSLIHITDANGKESRNINLNGTLIVYNRFGTYNSSNITLDTLLLRSDKTKSLEKLRSKGCHIYKGTKFLDIKYLEIDDLGSGSDKYSSNHAALAIDGQGDNPSNVSIDCVVIKSSDRHGAYITGTNHYFGTIRILKYGLGTTKGMAGMQDANLKDAQILSGLWLNRCNNSIFENIEIYTKNSGEGFPLKLDEGIVSMPSVIECLKLDVEYRDSLVLDDELTNVIVKRLKTIE